MLSLLGQICARKTRVEAATASPHVGSCNRWKEIGDAHQAVHALCKRRSHAARRCVRSTSAPPVCNLGMPCAVDAKGSFRDGRGVTLNWSKKLKAWSITEDRKGARFGRLWQRLAIRWLLAVTPALNGTCAP